MSADSALMPAMKRKPALGRIARTLLICALLLSAQFGAVVHGMAHLNTAQACGAQDVAQPTCSPADHRACGTCLAFAGIAAAAAPGLLPPVIAVATVESPVAGDAAAGIESRFTHQARAPPALRFG
jgi:hypothetical protein